MGRLSLNKQYFTNSLVTSKKVKEEIDLGLKLLNSVDHKIVSFFGGHKVKPGSKTYKHGENLAYTLGKKGFAIVSGGGPGIMEAANLGAMRAHVPSIALRGKLIKHETVRGNMYTHKAAFQFLFVRRFILSIKSEALVFYPGGFGTLNELFEYTVLMQLGIADKVPIILVDKSYWKGMLTWIKTELVNRNLLKGKADIDCLYVTDDLNSIVKKIIRG